ncbi:ROK family transcriptional regulator [Tessaracoccus lapidicaptus]|uniref:ROK family transcriptional regulator n=1 Tax=Tessaracoccus lapidicaptus TaxID=1427523 RepID=UPI003340BDF0
MHPIPMDPTTRSVALAVLRYGPISRAEVARMLGLSSGSLTRITKPLIEQGLLEQGPPSALDIGRPPVPLRIVDEAAQFLGVKIVPGHAWVVQTGLAGQVRHSEEISLDTDTLESTAQGLVEVIARFPTPAGVGVCLPASVEPDGVLHATRMLGWPGGVNLAGRISALTGLPCATANDIDGLTLYHHWFGAGRGLTDFVVVTFGLGVGCGAVVDDNLLLGCQGAAAILGRLWLPDGRIFGDVLSESAVAAAASEAVGRRLGFREALAEPRAAGAVDDAVRAMGHLAAAAAIAFAPARILLTGEGIDLLGGSLDAVREVMAEDWREDLNLPDLALQPLDFRDFARGAAVAAIRLRLTSGA